MDVVMALSVDARLVLSIKSPPWALGLHKNYDVSSWLHLTLLSFCKPAMNVTVFAATILQLTHAAHYLFIFCEHFRSLHLRLPIGFVMCLITKFIHRV